MYIYIDLFIYYLNSNNFNYISLKHFPSIYNINIYFIYIMYNMMINMYLILILLYIYNKI